MSTINLTFTNGELTDLNATAPWYASYYLHGTYEASTAEGAGHYSVTTEIIAQDWRTVINTAGFTPIYGDNHLLVFSDPPIGGAVPEISTWAMLALGFVFMAKMVLDKRVKRATVRIDSLGPPH